MPFMNKVLNNSVLPVLPDGGIHVLYYICGYFFAQWEKTVDKKEKMQKVFGTMAAVLMLGMAGSRLLADFQIQMAYNYPFTVLLALLLFAAGWSGSPEKRSGEEVQKHRTLWQAAGTLSFAVYLVHPVYVNLLYKFMKITPFTLLEQSGVQSVAAGQVRLLFLLLAFCLPVLALSMATAWLLRKIPVLKKYVL